MSVGKLKHCLAVNKVQESYCTSWVLLCFAPIIGNWQGGGEFILLH